MNVATLGIPRAAFPMNAAVDVLTPSIGRTPLETSSTYTPGCRNSGIALSSQVASWWRYARAACAHVCATSHLVFRPPRAGVGCFTAGDACEGVARFRFGPA